MILPQQCLVVAWDEKCAENRRDHVRVQAWLCTTVHMQLWCLLPVRCGIRVGTALGTFTTCKDSVRSSSGSALGHSNSPSPVSVLSSWFSPWADGLEVASVQQTQSWLWLYLSTHPVCCSIPKVRASLQRGRYSF